MRIFSFLTFLLFLFLISVTVQTSSAQCPTLKIVAPDSVKAGEKLMFSAVVQGGDQNVTPTYNWTVSSAAIRSGQGTSVIEMDLTGVDSETYITATVELGGYAHTCSLVASSTTTVLKKVEARKVAEYDQMVPKEDPARLDNFTIELMNDPTAHGYLIVYGGRNSRPNEAQMIGNKSKTYLVTQRGIDSGRLAIVNGGYREKAMVELWLVPMNAMPPQAMPTIDPSEVKPISKTKSTAKASTRRKK